jgi:hypothetical protein
MTQPSYVTQTELTMMKAEIEHYADADQSCVLDLSALSELRWSALRSLHRTVVVDRHRKSETEGWHPDNAVAQKLGRIFPSF